MKKYLSYILILIMLVGIFNSTHQIHAQTLQHCYNLDGTERTESTYEACLAAGGFWHVPTTPGTGTTAPASKIYNFLAPLPCTGDITTGCDNGKQVTFDPTNTTGQNSNLGIYLNLMIKLFIGICAVLAVIMIVMGGIQYMTSELPGNKEAGKERIMHAIFGLLLALGAWTLLNTINPDLLNTDLSSLANVTVTVTLDQANFAKTEQNVTSVGTGYTLNGTTSSGVSAFAQNSCASLNNITVNTAAKQANFCAGTNCVSVPINTGYGGVAETGQAQSGDGKTPKGTFTIGGDRRLGSNGNAVISQGGFNMGAAFINIGATINGSDRGIGFHGSAKDTMGTTNGCIRMTNDDLALLAPCMKTGTTITIN